MRTMEDGRGLRDEECHKGYFATSSFLLLVAMAPNLLAMASNLVASCYAARCS